MTKYIKPELKSLKPDLLIELTGPAVTAGYLNVGAARREVTELNVHKNQNVVICKYAPQRQDGIVRLG